MWLGHFIHWNFQHCTKTEQTSFSPLFCHHTHTHTSKRFKSENILCFDSACEFVSRTPKTKTAPCLGLHAQCLSTRFSSLRDFEFSTLLSSCILRILSLWSSAWCFVHSYTMHDAQTICDTKLLQRHPLPIFYVRIYAIDSLWTKKRYRCWSEWRYVHTAQLFFHAIWNIFSFKQKQRQTIERKKEAEG